MKDENDSLQQALGRAENKLEAAAKDFKVSFFNVIPGSYYLPGKKIVDKLSTSINGLK